MRFITTISQARLERDIEGGLIAIKPIVGAELIFFKPKGSKKLYYANTGIALTKEDMKELDEIIVGNTVYVSNPDR